MRHLSLLLGIEVLLTCYLPPEEPRKQKQNTELAPCAPWNDPNLSGQSRAMDIHKSNLPDKKKGELLLQLIKIDMTEKEVKDLLRGKVRIGHICSGPDENLLGIITFGAPYHVRVLTINGKVTGKQLLDDRDLGKRP